MKTIAVVMAAVAFALLPVTLFAAFRPAPAMERVVYVPFADVNSCAPALRTVAHHD